MWSFCAQGRTLFLAYKENRFWYHCITFVDALNDVKLNFGKYNWNSLRDNGIARTSVEHKRLRSNTGNAFVKNDNVSCLIT